MRRLAYLIVFYKILTALKNIRKIDHILKHLLPVTHTYMGTKKYLCVARSPWTMIIFRFASTFARFNKVVRLILSLNQ